MLPHIHDRELGVVAIGRNEGERLRRCLESVRVQCANIVYVDSGSQDGSVPMARALGVEVVELDLSIPFTAARARNEGLARLRAWKPESRLVQFVDGDCELMPGWIASARRALEEHPRVAAVCGRRRERFRDASIYNRLCDIEWNTPVGEADACGGDALMRVSALEQVGGYDPSIIAGEESDLCLRMRALGHRVLRIDADMTLHDAAITRLVQWWRRTVRTGYGVADSVARRGSAAHWAERQRLRSVFIWVVVFPLLVVLGFGLALQRSSGAIALGVAAGALLLLLAQTLRIALKRKSPGEDSTDALLYAASCMAAKLPQSVGMLRYLRHRMKHLRPRLIEYK